MADELANKTTDILEDSNIARDFKDSKDDGYTDDVRNVVSSEPELSSSNKNAIWSKNATAEKQDSQHSKQERKELIVSFLSNILTVLLTAAIIIGGFMLPTFLYPYIETHGLDYTKLSAPSANYIYPGTVRIYPWDVANPQYRSLTPNELNVINQSGAVDYLLSSLKDLGMKLELETVDYRNQTLQSFRCMQSQDPNEPDCFVLNNEDIDKDGDADVNFAVDFNGNIISFLLVTSELNSNNLTAPIQITANNTEVDDTKSVDTQDNGTDATGTNPANDETNTASDENTDANGNSESASAGANANTDVDDALDPEADGGNDVTSETGTESGGTTAATSAGEGSDGTEADTSAEANTDAQGTSSAQPEILNNPVPNIHFIGNDNRDIWAFSYIASREAANAGRLEVYFALRQLDLYYVNSYAHNYTELLAIQPTEDEQLQDIVYTQMALQVTPTESFRYYIYDLSSGARLILYIDPYTHSCRGFTLQSYTPLSAT